MRPRDFASFVVRLFLCTLIAIRAFWHVGKNVAFDRFWQNCVRGAQNEASQHRTCCCLARLTGSWRSPFTAEIGCLRHVCSKMYYEVDTFQGRPRKTHFKFYTLFRSLVGYGHIVCQTQRMEKCRHIVCMHAIFSCLFTIARQVNRNARQGKHCF